MVELSPDEIVFWKWGFVSINETIVFTWAVMALLVFLAWFTTRRLSVEPPISHWQNLFETLIGYMDSQIQGIAQMSPDRYLPFSGTLFLFISVANLLDIVPGYRTPTSSLSTTAALAICVFFAVPIYGVAQAGIAGYLRHYAEPSILMLPFHIIGEFSRTIALAVRLVREYDERVHVNRYSAHHCALVSARASGVARASDRPGAGLHIRSSGYRLHCFGQFE